MFDSLKNNIDELFKKINFFKHLNNTIIKSLSNFLSTNPDANI